MSTMDNTPPPPPVDPTKPVKFSFEQEASPEALLVVRHDFNPGMMTDVARLKLLAAALMSFTSVALLTTLTSVTVAAALGLGILVPPPMQAVWHEVFVYLALAATLTPGQLL